MFHSEIAEIKYYMDKMFGERGKMVRVK